MKFKEYERATWMSEFLWCMYVWQRLWWINLRSLYTRSFRKATAHQTNQQQFWDTLFYESVCLIKLLLCIVEQFEKLKVFRSSEIELKLKVEGTKCAIKYRWFSHLQIERSCCEQSLTESQCNTCCPSHHLIPMSLIKSKTQHRTLNRS